MRAGRVIGNIFAVILFCAGMGIYTVHASLKNVVSDQLISASIDEMVNTAIVSGTDIILKDMPAEIKEQVPSEIMKMLPKDVQNEMESVKEEIANDPQVLALTEKYMEAIIAGSADEHAVMPDVNKDIEDIIETNVPKIASAVGTEVTNEEVSVLAKEIVKEVNAQSMFDKGMDKIRSSITPQQQKMLSTLSFVQSSQCFMISIVFMAIAVGIVALMKKSLYKWMSLIGATSICGGIIALIAGTFAKMFVEKAVVGLPSIVGTVGKGVTTSIFQSGLYFTALGVFVVVVYFITRFIANRVVYE